MRKYESMAYTKQIRWRIRALYLMAVAMLAYMVAVAELGGGDSRVVTPFADMVGDLIFFGGFLYIIIRIVHNRKLLRNRLLLKEQRLEETDERNRYLHDKSGGIVLDILLVCMLFATMTSALFDMAAFYASFAILALALILKTAAYLFYSRIY